MARRLAAADAYEILILDLTDVPFLDSSASLALEDAIRQAMSRGKQVILTGLHPSVRKVLGQLGVSRLLPKDRVTPTRSAGIAKAKELALAANG